MLKNFSNKHILKKKKHYKYLFLFHTDFTKSLGLPGFDRLKEIFSLDINKVTLGQALDYLDEFGLSKLKENIIKLLQKVEVSINISLVLPCTVRKMPREVMQFFTMRGCIHKGKVLGQISRKVLVRSQTQT